MKLHKGDNIEITLSKNKALLFNLNGYLQHYEPDHEYILKRCRITWQQAVKSLELTDKLNFTL